MVTIRLYEGDREVLQRFFPKQGYNEVIRKLVNKLANRLREKENEIESNIELETNPEVNYDAPTE